MFTGHFVLSCVPTAISTSMYIRMSVDSEEMTRCLVKEIKSRINKSSISIVTSIYFGGGTPSLMEPSIVESVINAVAHCAHLKSDAEINLEANPTSTEVKKLRHFKEVGVTRLSLGIQSLIDRDLQLMNRDHTVAEAQRALREAHEVFPEQVNIDVIFGRPSQTLNEWIEELDKALELCSNHISLYQLTVEQGTPLKKSVQSRQLVLPGSDVVADMYEAAVKMAQDYNFSRYEVSNFARKGFESKHNLSYWSGRDYIGIGPGAHSRYWDQSSGKYIHTVNVLEPKAWIKRVLETGCGIQLRKELTKMQRLEEVVTTSLRTTSGLTNEIWQLFLSPNTPALHVHEVFSLQQNDDLAKLVSSDMLIVDRESLRATAKGLMVLDSIVPLCIESLNKVHII